MTEPNRQSGENEERIIEIEIERLRPFKEHHIYFSIKWCIDHSFFRNDCRTFSKNFLCKCCICNF